MLPGEWKWSYQSHALRLETRDEKLNRSLSHPVEVVPGVPAHRGGEIMLMSHAERGELLVQAIIPTKPGDI